MTTTEIRLADIRFEGAADPISSGALTHAAGRARNEGSREVDGIAKVIGDPLRIYLTAEGQALMVAVGKKVGGTCNFAGIAVPPTFNYY